MNIMRRILKWFAIVIASLIGVVVASFLFLAYPTMAEIDRMAQRGAIQIDARKETMILDAFSTRDLEITVFREAFLKLHDGAWYKSRKLPESVTIYFMRDLLLTKSEWAAAFCDTNDCLDEFARVTYQSTFEELDDERAGCALAYAKGAHRFKKCDETINQEKNK